MESEEQKICPNCKREIPAMNFNIHVAHCARNIKVCPVCKEPVPQQELDEHHDKLHKLLPCKECGEKVCGTDLEDHIRDSCGHTIKSCRYCELELPRRELPPHESYCGVRTEQCDECKEWVMIKYRQLHLDSNHGFLRLDDDPEPQPRRELQKSMNISKTSNLPKTNNLPKVANVPKPTNHRLSTSNGYVPPFTKNTNMFQNRPRTEIRYLGSNNDAGSSNNEPATSIRNLGSSNIGPSTSIQGLGSSNIGPSTTIQSLGSSNSGPSTSNIGNGVEKSPSSVSRPQNAQNLYNGINKTPKRNNDRPQVNMNVASSNKVDKEPMSRGAVKKRPAPKPPTRDPPTRDPKREMAYHSALLRSQQEEKRRLEQNAYNLAHGLPPVLSAAEKLEKLRKMDALHNREVEDTSYKDRLQGRVWMDRSNVPAGNALGSDGYEENAHLEADRRRPQRSPRSPDIDVSELSLSGQEPVAPLHFRNIKPMSPQQFMDRFKELQLRKDGTENNNVRTDDRFSQIKSSLRELRRGLNEVTAPYNSTNSNATYSSTNRSPARSPRADSGDVELPCEFCGAPVPASELVQHQTGCRPDLAQYRPSSTSPPRSPRPSPPAPGEPVIPCEFCAESLPVYLINEHQEQCGRESNMLYVD